MSIPVSTLLEVLHHERFGVEYQPLVDPRSKDIVGYEALSRFIAADGCVLNADLFFKALYGSPLMLYQVEYRMKEIQLNEAPGGELFINLAPDAFAVADDPPEPHPMIALLKQRPRVVMEIIENCKLSDARRSRRMAEAFSRHGFQLALDDIGAPQSMLSLPLLSQINCLKFDKSWLKRLGRASPRSALFAMIQYARDNGKRTVLEGVETEAHLELARRLDIDLVQGFLFRDRFISYY